MSNGADWAQGREHRGGKTRIVEYHWESWDWTAEEPEEFPEGSEPEDYIFARPHSEEAAAALGDVWQVVLPTGATVDTEVQRAPWDYDVRIHLATWSGNHLFWGRKRGEDSGSWIIVTEVGQHWLQQKVGK